jgi:hypothetical protein
LLVIDPDRAAGAQTLTPGEPETVEILAIQKDGCPGEDLAVGGEVSSLESGR